MTDITPAIKSLSREIDLCAAIQGTFGKDDRPAGPCVRDNDELLDRYSGGYLPGSELRAFYWHLYRCQECREFVEDLLRNNLLSVPR